MVLALRTASMGTLGDPGGSSDPARVHVPVLVEELLAALEVGLSAQPKGLVVDATLGAGGHAFAVLQRFPQIELLGLDWDPDSLALGAKRLAEFGPRAHVQRARHGDLLEVLGQRCAPPPVAVYADLGVCSLHFDRPERGFSLAADGPLDMRMDPAGELTAADIVNGWSESDLADLFFHAGGERRARRVARALCAARARAPFLRTLALAELVERELGPSGKVHAATRVFQALRVAVNLEEQQLERLLVASTVSLAPGGVAAWISFHSGEDGRIKRFLERGVRAGHWESQTRRPLEPSRAEVRSNPRARSARLRAARRTSKPASPAEFAAGEGQP